MLEVVIAIAIMGVAFAALLGGMLTSASMSGLHRLTAGGQTELLNAVETVKAAPYAGGCAPVNPLYPVTPSAGWTVTETIEFWNGTEFGPTCYETLLSYFATQRITLTVATTDGRVSRTETILKRG